MNEQQQRKGILAPVENCQYISPSYNSSISSRYGVLYWRYREAIT